MAIVVIWILCGLTSAYIARGRGAGGCGWFALGVILGPIGFLLALLVTGRECPSCHSKIHDKATRCPKCGTEIPPQAVAGGRAEPPNSAGLESHLPATDARNAEQDTTSCVQATCTHCGEQAELEEDEVLQRKFVCPYCGYEVEIRFGYTSAKP